MKRDPEIDNEALLLIERILTETAEAEDLTRLSDLISSDAAARKLYLDYCEMHSSLMFKIRSEQATGDAFTQLENRVASHEPLPSHNIGNSDPSATTGPSSKLFLLSPVPLTAMVTTTLVTAIFVMLLSLNGWFHSPQVSKLNDGVVSAPVDKNDPVDRNKIAATLTGVVDCVWSNASQQAEIAEPLRHGSQLAIESGLIQVTFESGAKMVVEGPAEFTLVSSMEAEFQIGRMTSYCPPSAHGFTVQTPEATVVDLGTEFGIDVEQGGKTEVHVFSGEVVSWNKGNDASKLREKIHLQENHSVTFEAGQTLKVVEVDIEKYVRSIDMRLDEDELPNLPVKRELVLWLAADKQVKADSDGRVLVWQDLVAGDNQHFDNAWQFVQLWRPVLVDQSIGGKPAIRFNGRSSFLMTTPLSTTNDQTVFVVFSFAERATERLAGGQLLNYNGPPHRHIFGHGSKPGVLQIGDLASTKMDYQKPGFLRGHAFTGYRDGNVVDAGEIYTNNLLPEKQGILCTYQYSYSEGKSELFIDGESQAISSAPTPIEVTSRKVIGRHGAQNFFFYGDISEMLIFNTTLTPEEINDVNLYLAERYLLELSDSK